MGKVVLMPKRKAPSTAWKPGQSGNPEGRRSSKLITDQFRAVLSEDVEDDKGKKVKKLRLLAESVVKQAIDGSAPHAAFLLDRLEGKVPQENYNVNEVGDALAALLQAIDGRSRDIVAPIANGHDKADDGETVH